MSCRGPRPKIQGEKHYKAKLTETQVREIHRLAHEGVREILIAERFGVDRGTVGHIKRQETWRHLWKSPQPQNVDKRVPLA